MRSCFFCGQPSRQKCPEAIRTDHERCRAGPRIRRRPTGWTTGTAPYCPPSPRRWLRWPPCPRRLRQVAGIRARAGPRAVRGRSTGADGRRTPGPTRGPGFVPPGISQLAADATLPSRKGPLVVVQRELVARTHVQRPVLLAVGGKVHVDAPVVVVVADRVEAAGEGRQPPQLCVRVGTAREPLDVQRRVGVLGGLRVELVRRGEEGRAEPVLVVLELEQGGAADWASGFDPGFDSACASASVSRETLDRELPFADARVAGRSLSGTDPVRAADSASAVESGELFARELVAADARVAGRPGSGVLAPAPGEDSREGAGSGDDGSSSGSSGAAGISRCDGPVHAPPAPSAPRPPGRWNPPGYEATSVKR